MEKAGEEDDEEASESAPFPGSSSGNSAPPRSRDSLQVNQHADELGLRMRRLLAVGTEIKENFFTINKAESGGIGSLKQAQWHLSHSFAYSCPPQV